MPAQGGTTLICASWKPVAGPDKTTEERGRRRGAVVSVHLADGLEADWIAEACDRSQKEHRPVRIEEVRIS
jgi:hypothetical protein